MKTLGRHLLDLTAAGAVLTVMLMASLVIAIGVNAIDTAARSPQGAQVVALR